MRSCGIKYNLHGQHFRKKINKSLPFLLLTATMVQLVSLTLIYSPANICFSLRPEQSS